jgi:hypothetical protein
MDILDYLWTLVKAYNPNQYERLLERPGRDLLAFFLLTLSLGILVFLCVLIPMTLNYTATLGERLGPLTQFRLDANVTADGLVVVLDHPAVVIDLNANTTPPQTITLTDDGILYPAFFLFGNAELPWDEFHDLKAQSRSGNRLLSAIILFMLPSIAFWFILLSLAKIFIVALLLVLLGYIVPKVFGYSITLLDTLKVCALALPSIFILDLGLYPVAPLFWWGFALTIIYFIIGVAIVSEPRSRAPGTAKHGFEPKERHQSTPLHHRQR